MLKGVILSNELSGPPMANVQVAVLDGANATVSDSVGRFTLVFPNREPGEKVQLIISHSDRVVVNYESLKRLLPKDPATETVTLLLCESRLVEEMRRRFYRLRSLTAIDENYARRIKALEQKNQATREALEKLRG